MIYNGVDTDAFRDRWSPEERRALRSALGFPDADYVVGLSALLRPEKNPPCNWSRPSRRLRAKGIPA